MNSKVKLQFHAALPLLLFIFAKITHMVDYSWWWALVSFLFIAVQTESSDGKKVFWFPCYIFVNKN